MLEIIIWTTVITAIAAVVIGIAKILPERLIRKLMKIFED